MGPCVIHTIHTIHPTSSFQSVSLVLFLHPGSYSTQFFFYSSAFIELSFFLVTLLPCLRHFSQGLSATRQLTLKGSVPMCQQEIWKGRKWEKDIKKEHETDNKGKQRIRKVKNTWDICCDMQPSDWSPTPCHCYGPWMLGKQNLLHDKPPPNSTLLH